ncbi:MULTISPECIES: hypothetical protein [Aerosakkonema]|uniref:hypothetical protein n=1 Tax=Aerosakkonema TaxID=1246629 RepID=UPI0035BA5FDE
MLAYWEDSIPEKSFSERLHLAIRETGKWNGIRQYQIAAVQAYAMHEFHPLHCDRHLRET